MFCLKLSAMNLSTIVKLLTSDNTALLHLGFSCFFQDVQHPSQVLHQEIAHSKTVFVFFMMSEIQYVQFELTSSSITEL